MSLQVLRSQYKSFHKPDELVDYGIVPLTGEACAYGMRVLFDLSQEGKDIVASWLSLTQDAFYQNWNSVVGDEPAVASVMLDRQLIVPLMRFILVHVEKCEALVHFPDGTITGFRSRTDVPDYLDGEAFKTEYFVHSSAHHSEAGRNVHQSSQRTI
jgi:hypothetical protein